MKCPHCGIYYMDEERECPICGKRPGIVNPKHKQVSYTPKAKKDNSTQAAWQRAAETQHTRNNSNKPKKKKFGCLAGCLTIIIIIVAINVIVGILGAINFAAFTAPEPESDYTYDDSIEESCEPFDIFPVGTWANTDSSMTIAIDDSGAISWTDGIHTSVDNYPLCYRLALTEENAQEHCLQQELERFPITQYTYYTLYAWDYDTDLSINLSIHIPKEVQLSDITEFDYYDYDSDTFQTFTRVSDATELPEEAIIQNT